MTARKKAMIKDGLWVGSSYAVMVGISSWHDNADESVFSKVGWLIFQGVFMGSFFGLTFRPAFSFVSRHLAPAKEMNSDPSEGQ